MPQFWDLWQCLQPVGGGNVEGPMFHWSPSFAPPGGLLRFELQPISVSESQLEQSYNGHLLEPIIEGEASRYNIKGWKVPSRRDTVRLLSRRRH